MSVKYILETERLRLREFSPELDAEWTYSLNLDEEVMRYTGDKAFESVEHSFQFLQAYSDYERNGYGRWTVELKSTGECLGWCGLKFHNDENFVDIGYRFIRKHWNQGYATEASQACLKHGFDVFQIEEVIGRAHRENGASIRIFEKLGMHPSEKTFNEGDLDVVYSINRQEFEDRQIVD